MSEEKLNQEERDIEDIFEDEPEESNDSNGDESEDAPTLSDDALAEYNKRVGKNYKSWDDVAKREKEADKAFAQGQGKKPEKKENPKYDDEVVEELLLTKHPEAEHVLDELKDIAAQKGVSVLKLYRESKYFQGEAKVAADAKRNEDEARGKIGYPSNGTGKSSKQSIEFSKVDLENPEHTKWLRSDPKRLEEFNKWILSKK